MEPILRMQRQLTLPVLVDNWWGDSYPEDKERFWQGKLKVTPEYFKIQDPDLWKVGLAEPMDFARRQDKAVVLGIDNNLFQNGPAEEIEKRVHEYMEVIEEAGGKMSTAALLLGVEAVRRGELADARDRFDAMPRSGIAAYSAPLALAWTRFGLGETDAALEALLRDDDADMSTVVHRLEGNAREDPNRVKVVLDRRGFALYFSRSPIPYLRGGSVRGPDGTATWQHVGIYCYRRAFLLDFVDLPRTPAEQAEELEQLRALEHGFAIRAAIVEGWSSTPVDVPEDVARVEAMLAKRGSRGEG